MFANLGFSGSRKAQKADPRNKASQTFCGTFSGTKVNPWNHPQKNASEKKPSAHLPEE